MFVMRFYFNSESLVAPVGVAVLSFFAIWFTHWFSNKILKIPSPIRIGWPAITAYITLACSFIGAHLYRIFIDQSEPANLEVIIKAALIFLPFGVLMAIARRDDVRAVSGKYKLPAVLAATACLFCVLVFPFHNPLTDDISYWGGRSWALLLVAAVAMVFSFALPLIDGINGLFCGYVLILCGTFYLWNIAGYFDRGGCVVGGGFPDLAFAGACFFAGVLPFNFPKGRVILGEAIVLPVSALLAGGFASSMWLSLSARIRYVPSGGVLYVFPLPLLLMLYPVLDLFLVVICRALKRRSPFRAGHDHLHHRLAQNQKWLSDSGVVGLILSAVTFQAVVLTTLYMFSLRDIINVPIGLIMDFSWPEYARAAVALDSAVRWLVLALGLLPLLGLFFVGYTKVDPYQSGAVDERGRP